MASNEEIKLTELAEILENVDAKILDPDLVETNLIMFALGRLNAIKRLGESPRICLRSEINEQLQTIATEPWDEASRKRLFDKHIATLDSFDEDSSATSGLAEVAQFLRLIVKGFEAYKNKTRQ